QMDYDIRRLERQYDRHEELFEKALLSAEEFENTQDELEYVQRNRELTLAGYRSDSLRNAAQISQMQNNVTRMEANYEVIERILDNLTVRAPVTGFLTSLDAEIGELRGSGDRFGQIDVTDGFRVEARIDEFYINRVQRDQQAVTLPIGGQEYQMVATKVYPEVREGRFTVDLEFTGEAPPDIRRGQTIRFRLELGDLEEALLIPRGGFYQSTGGNAIFVLDDDGSTARLQPIRVGRQNDRHYEVLEGLTPGDRVIVNSYDTYGDTETLVLK
ncbi:MAG: HlyD family efflux transporter periplasmic adaptor subunit, partial [Bacteroidota bacterium]